MAEMNYITDTARVSTSALYGGDYIAHHGIKGQKWGVRRYRNEDGTLTSAGKKRLSKESRRLDKAQERALKSGEVAAKRSATARRYAARPKLLKNDISTARVSSRLAKARNRYDKNLKRADKLYNRHVKEYSDQKVSSLSEDQIRRGEEIRNRIDLNDKIL